jgi:hypothetical protein
LTHCSRNVQLKGKLKKMGKRRDALSSAARMLNGFILPDEQNKFPRYADGDVQIIISASRQYCLHSSILKLVSPTLAQLIDDSRPPPLPASALKKGAKQLWRFVAVENNVVSELSRETVPMVLKAIQPSADAKANMDISINLVNENGRVPDRIHEVRLSQRC